jgi:rubrerythrin
VGRKFARKIEDFTCENCGKFVKGNGYTDHCPFCLFAKHVDINPGDREETCQGLMQPVGAEMKNDGYVIFYKCLKCGKKHRVKSVPEDNFEEIATLISQDF